MSQPDGIPREAEKPARDRNKDGTFKDQQGGPDATVAPVHPSYLTDIARSFGFDDADFASMSSDALGRAVHKAQKRDAEWHQRVQAQQPQAKPPEPEPELDLGLNPEEYDEKVVGAFNKLKSRDAATTKELKALRDELAQSKARDEARSRQQAIQLVDDAFEALGPEYEEYFGKGSVDEVSARDPKALRRRIIALQETGLDVSIASGKQILSKLKKVADEVLQIKKAKEPEPEPEARRPGRPTKKEWEEGGTAVPTQRSNAEEPKGYERAVRNAERRAKGNGVPVAPSHAKEDAELLASFPKR